MVRLYTCISQTTSVDRKSLVFLPEPEPLRQSFNAEQTSATQQPSDSENRPPEPKIEEIYSRKRFLRQMRHNNNLQAKMLSEEHSLWNACAAIDRSDGRNNWNRTLLLAKLLMKFEIACPSLDGREFGVFGETPLHVLLLFNPKPESVSDPFFELWRLCNAAVRLKQYDKEPYVGENLLHIAIVRGYGTDFIAKLLNEPDAKGLLQHRATGKFFKNSEMSGGYYTMLGETPLGFAACLGHPSVFQFLWQEIKKSQESEFKTENGHNLLHIAVLASASKDPRTGKPAPDILAVDIFDRVWNVLAGSETDPHKLLTKEKNKDGHTPLSLAAAHGSIDIFLRIFDQELLTTLWTYNSVHCKKMFLEGVDLDLDAVSEGQTQRTGQSLLETLVQYQRKDILHHSCINELIEAKWDMYGREIFYRELLATSVFTVAIYLLPMSRFDAAWGFRAWQTRLWHIAVHALVAFFSRSMCFSRTEPTALQRFVFGDPNAWKFLIGSMLVSYPQWVLLEAWGAFKAVIKGSLNLSVEEVKRLTWAASSWAVGWFQLRSTSVRVRVWTMYESFRAYVRKQELGQGMEDGDMQEGESLFPTCTIA